MTFEAIRRRLRHKSTHIPDVALLTGIPKRTLYRLRKTTTIPAGRTVLALQKWAADK